MNKKAMKRNRALSICLLATMLLSLMSPFAVAAAMADEGDYICGKIEHVHDDSCIQDLGWHFLCMDEDTDDQYHEHDESCYDSDGYLVCLPAVRAAGEGLYHEHNEFCYDERGELVCPLQEQVAHVHHESCYANTILQDTNQGTNLGATEGDGETQQPEGDGEEKTTDASTQPDGLPDDTQASLVGSGSDEIPLNSSSLRLPWPPSLRLSRI